jgi:hypothetical protein
MMMGVVAGDRADNCTFDAALGVSAPGRKHNGKRQCSARDDRFHSVLHRIPGNIFPQKARLVASMW